MSEENPPSVAERRAQIDAFFTAIPSTQGNRSITVNAPKCLTAEAKRMASGVTNARRCAPGYARTYTHQER